MSWNVRLTDKEGRIVEVPKHFEGGMPERDGCTQAYLNITSNYTPQFNKIFKQGLPTFLNQKSATEAVPKLLESMLELGFEPDEDYWAATPGNAGFTLGILMLWAMDNPDTTFRVG